MPSDFATSALKRAHLARRELSFLVALRVLPPKVAVFQWRARRLASHSGDEFSRASATRPAKLATLLRLAEDRRCIVELGTATGWTSISLLLAAPRRMVVSYDFVHRPQLDLYLNLVSAEVRRRLRFICAEGEAGPRADMQVDLLYIDSSHEREATIREVHAWQPVLLDGALIVFDDYAHDEYPGVSEAVHELGLDGYERDGLFVHHVRAPAQSSVTRGPARDDGGMHVSEAK
jgi:predicted O-methyltransferase YrrM